MDGWKAFFRQAVEYVFLQFDALVVLIGRFLRIDLGACVPSQSKAWIATTIGGRLL